MPWYVVPEGSFDWRNAGWATGVLSGAAVVTPIRWDASGVPEARMGLWIPTSASLREVVAALPVQGGPYLTTKVESTELCQFPAECVSLIQGMLYRCRNDRDWTMDWVSDGVFELTGYTAAEIQGESGISFTGMIVQADRQGVSQAVNVAIANREVYRIRYRIRHRNGMTLWVFEQGRALFSEGGEVLGLVGHIVLEPNNRGAAEREVISQGRAATYNVVVVDDEVSIVTLLSKLLERANCRVIRATSMEEALRGVLGFDGVIDVLLTDVVLEQGSGCDLAEKLRWRLPQLKVIYMSGYAADGRVLEEVNQGRAAFLSKPFLPSTALEKIRHVMGENG